MYLTQKFTQYEKQIFVSLKVCIYEIVILLLNIVRNNHNRFLKFSFLWNTSKMNFNTYIKNQSIFQWLKAMRKWQNMNLTRSPRTCVLMLVVHAQFFGNYSFYLCVNTFNCRKICCSKPGLIFNTLIRNMLSLFIML